MIIELNGILKVLKVRNNMFESKKKDALALNSVLFFIN
jgi:hypothetical protein